MNDMRIDRALRRIPGRAAFWALAGATLFVAHDAVYLVQVGPGAELARVLRTSGHAYWGAASTGLALIALALAVAYCLRLRHLCHRARDLSALPGPISPRRNATRLATTWTRLFVVVAIGFTIQENLEHAFGHGHVIGLGALAGPEYPLAVPILAAISGVAALIAAAFTGVEHALVDAIAIALARGPRSPRRLVRPASSTRPARRPRLGLATAGRAPPRALVHVS